MHRIPIIALIFSRWAHGQFLPNLQAEKPEEFDAYLDVVEASGPRAVTAAAERFLSAWPLSQLRLRVHELQVEAYRKLGNATKAVEATDAGLAIAPDYAPLLAARAGFLVNESAPSALLRAESDARRLLALLEQAKAPRTVTPDLWKKETARLRAEARAALGVVAFKRGNTNAAVQDLEAAVSADQAPKHLYRLAMLYVESGRKEKARLLFERVVSGGEPELAARARQALTSYFGVR